MQKLAIGLLSLLLICDRCAVADDRNSAASHDVGPSFPKDGYRPLPPHFQPRRLIAANPDKVTVAPPLLPSYDQPAIPAEGSLWVPGFWAWRKSVPDYFWVPGTWVRPPEPNLLWTPPYWSKVEDGYSFHSGYWALEVGFYGGIAYGFGYFGNGYQGGRWKDGKLIYNSVVNNLGTVDVSSNYDQPVAIDREASRASYNGGRRGTTAKLPRSQGDLAEARHIAPNLEQQRHFELAAVDRSQYSKLNNGEPPVAATPQPGILAGPGVMPSKRKWDHGTTNTGDAAAVGTK